MRHESALGTWEMVRGRPDPRLRGVVLGYVGYAERTVAPLRRLESATVRVPLILSLGPELVVDGVRHASFAAGIDDGPTVTEHAGEQLGIQVDLAPLGAGRLLGVAMAELTRRVVGVDELLGPDGERLLTTLRDAPDWPARFRILDAALVARLTGTAPPAPEVAYAWSRLDATGGAAAIGALARETGWSRRHLTARFREQVGLPPKAVARIMRFERACALLRARQGRGLADAAYACGYADQAHLNRDFRAFTGTTPTAFAARLLPDGGGVAAGEVANVQDGLGRAA